MWRHLFLVAVLGLVACGDDSASMDAGRLDSALSDVGMADVGPADGAVSDAASLDGGRDGFVVDAPMLDASGDAAMAEGFGYITGPCGRLAVELGSADPSFYSTRLDFMMDGYDEPEERPLLTEDAVRLLEAPNAGGSSKISEAFALETLVRCEGGDLVATENEIVYDPMESSKTDFLIAFGGVRIGVSVVRAFTFPLGSPYTLAQAQDVIGGKLDDILESSANVTVEYAWDKQILAVLAPDDMPLDSVMAAWESFDDVRRADTILYVIVTDGDDEAVYVNR